MSDSELADRRILVVEDEYLLANELQSYLVDAGAVVIGPVGNVDDALRLIDNEPAIDGAVLDANLQGVMVFPVADRLDERDVPYVLTTGYDASALPPRFRHIERLDKPTSMSKLCRTMSQVIEQKRN